jgi:hypothetical protein
MTTFLRSPSHRYEDPLDRIWVTCAERIGFRVVRTDSAYASTDGKGTLLIGQDSSLDPDDCLAQMILHELCHALVEGPEGEGLSDWGLDNASGRDTWREHATLRLQAFLADGGGVRDFFAPTTDFRVKFWPELGDDPLFAPAESGGRREPSCVAARIGAWRASQPRWAPHLKAALAASAAIAAVVPKDASSSKKDTSLPSLWNLKGSPPLYHPTGHAPQAAYYGDHGCNDCAWRYQERQSLHCHYAPLIRIGDYAPACVRWEPEAELNCETCGACCREAYHAVDVSPRDSVLKEHPELVVITDRHRKLKRDGDRCAALAGGHHPLESYVCSIYEQRPKTCRDFPRGGFNCLDARRRVGLSL